MTRRGLHGATGGVLAGLVLAGVVLGGCATSRYLSYRTTPDYPRDVDESIELPGLRHPVRVYLDQAGIAHIDAGDEVDLARATGFFQSRNRFFAMDMLRRFARGRMSELVGEQRILSGTTVDFDVSMRGWGMDAAVREDAAGLDPESREIMDAFVEGVNAAVAPEPWTVEDSFAVGRLNAWGVTHNWQQELSRLLLALEVGLDRAQRIYGSDWWRGGTTLPPGDSPHALPPAVAPEMAGMFPPKPYPGRLRDGRSMADDSTAVDAMTFTCASNSWVVGGDRSVSGKPVQANDPHLTHMLPSLLYQQHLRAPGVDVIGAGIAGLPYVLAGHNGAVAWGTTSLVGDAVDLYVEKAAPGDPGSVVTPAGPRPLDRTEQVVRIRQGKSFEERRFTLRRSAHGALLNDMYPHLFPADGPLVSVRWEPRGVSASIRGLRLAARAGTVEELREALLGMATPASAWTAADTSGAIAFFVTGSLPLRPNHLGTFPVPGWLDAYEWAGMTDPRTLPFAVSRTGGIFAHANNLVSDPSLSDVFVHVDAAPSYRYDRIVELLKSTGPHSMQTLADVQVDVKLNRAKRLLPIMLKDLARAPGTFTPMERKALDLLKAWDYEAGAGSAATSIFFATYREAVVEALRDEVGPEAFQFLLSQRYSTNVADLWFDRANHPVWDDRGTKRVEMRRDVVAAAFRRAVAWLRRELGLQPEEWRWGKLHYLQIRHAFGGKKSISRFMNLRPAAVGGALDSVWKSHFDLGNEKHPFAVVAGPSYRQVVDLGDIRHGLWVSDTGVSGWPGSPQYGDQHEAWKRGEFVPMLSDWDEIAASAEAAVLLAPPAPAEATDGR